MKALLWVSIAANVVLAAFLITRGWVDSPFITTAVKPADDPTQTQPDSNPEKQSSSTAGVRQKQLITSPAPDETDLSAYADRLRVLGLAEHDVADVIFHRLHNVFHDRYKAIEKANDHKYWLAYDSESIETDVTVLEKQALRWEFRNQLADILGEKWRYETRLGSLSFHNAELDFLPPAKQAALNDLRELFDLRERRLSTPGGVQSPELQSLRKRFQDDIASVLSPVELEQHQLRLSTAAVLTRRYLSQMDPAEEEFKAVYELVNRYGAKATFSSQSKEVVSELRKLLGADRYRQFFASQDRQYTQLKRTADERGYSMEQTLSLAEIKLEIQKEKRQMFADRGMSSSDKRTKLMAFRDTLADAAKEILGVDIVEDPAIAGYLGLEILQLQIDWQSNQ